MKKADFLGVTFCLRLLAFLGRILSSAGSGRQRLKDNPGNQLTTASALGLCRLLSTFLTLMFYITPSYFSRSNRNVSTTSGAELKFLLSLKKKKKVKIMQWSDYWLFKAVASLDCHTFLL